jgi:hypothetical protein
MRISRRDEPSAPYPRGIVEHALHELAPDVDPRLATVAGCVASLSEKGAVDGIDATEARGSRVRPGGWIVDLRRGPIGR